MSRSVRFLAAFTVTSVLLTALSVTVARGWRPATDRPTLGPVAEEALPAPIPVEVSQRAVTVPGAGDGDSTAAWIVQPTGTEQRPGAVLIHGAGSGSRDGLLAEAHALASAGIAAIVYDKRSTGYNAVQRDFGLLAEDALRAADTLGAAPGVDPTGVGLMGWSEGGWVVAEAARREAGRIAFAGLMSAPVVPPASQISWTARRSLPAMPRGLEKATATMVGAGRTIQPWTGYDSRPGLAALDVPVLGFWGADDSIVPVNEAVGTVRDAVAGPFSLHVLPGTGHDLPVDSRYLERAARWLTDGAPSGHNIRGVEAATNLGVGALPQPSWISHPLVQIAASIAAGVAALSIRWRPRGERRASAPVRRGAH